MGARYHDPAVGRFISRDPADADDSRSSYVYAENNPLTKVVPDGLFTWDISGVKLPPDEVYLHVSVRSVDGANPLGIARLLVRGV